MNSKPKNTALSDSFPHPEPVFVIAKGAGIIFAGNIVGSGVRYLFLMIVARHMDLALFGLFSLGFAVFSVAEVFACLGMNRGVLRFVPVYHMEEDSQRLKGTLLDAASVSAAGGCLATLGLIAFSGFLSKEVFHAPQLASMLRVFAIGIPFSVLTTLFLAATQGLKIMRYKVYVRDLLEPLLRLICVFLMFYAGYRLWGPFFAVVISVISGTFLSYFLCRKVFSSILQNDIRTIHEIRNLISFVWPLFLSSGLRLLELWVPVFVLGYYVLPEVVGIFGAAHRTLLLAHGILLSFNTVFVSFISERYRNGRLQELGELFKTVSGWIFSTSFPLLLIMILFSREILMLFGYEFISGADCLIILCVGEIINASGGPLGVMLEMSGRSRITLTNAIVHFVIQAGLCLILIPMYGIIGAAAARTVSVVFMRVVLFLEVHLLLRVNPFRTSFYKPLISGGATFCFLILLKDYLFLTGSLFPALALGSVIFIATYGMVLYFLGFSDEDRMIFGKIRSILHYS